ncbi:type III restriction protein res subunit [Candidatus Scalindua japonica]|uniref:Type III restriction protein res subunit n=1 Tax=Candidatus Scalindua japonica TaxID=1284222 RepID=A0A286U1H0_9BACT|nr:DEAD/DEAH box helicase [Candidatus Scalindua japonica]GAX61993.1 type III restriction protein res subunit [Candidatus Scalindua japonica]
MIQQGLYEQLINKLISSKLNDLDRNNFYINETAIDKDEAAGILSQYLCDVIRFALNLISGDEKIEKQIELSNKIIILLRDELNNEEFDDNLITTEARVLSAIFSKIDARFSDIKKHLKEITPYTGLSQSELFTGNNAGISLESEIKKEILSSDRINFIVSFIKWAGIRIFENELLEFTKRGGKLRVITTSYMGATDFKAVEFLSELRNTEIKVSYNSNNERLHAKAYLFCRNTGFHTGYIGSSNISRSALTNGLEWNLKVTTKEVGHIIDKFQKTFDTYWQDKEFELFKKTLHSEKLRSAIKSERITERNNPSFYFDIKPYHFQEEILEKLEAERIVHNRYRNLIVAATGTGKTVISAFDFKNYKKQNTSAKLLFIAHRKEILQQAQKTFQGVLRDNNFGELWVDGIEPEKYDCIFASIQTLNNRIDTLNLSKTFYDFIIVDEVHHIAASSYRTILEHFKPEIILGLTATPERMDGEDILKDFCNCIAAEIRLPEALNRKLLCPFQYFGVTDSIDLSNVEWRNGRYLPSELTHIYMHNDKRIGEIISNLRKYLSDINDVKALCFCVTQEHAKYMAEKFSLVGFKSDYLVSSRQHLRDEIRTKFSKNEINYLFVVDIFNEGVDLPNIDTILFLRPTESLTIFLQQLGRGLRFAEGKDCLTILDFVGNSRPEYDFEGKFRALVGKTCTSIQKEIEDDFPHLPLGCTIILEKKAKDSILENIKKATSFSKNQLLTKLRNFKHQTTLSLNLKNFSTFYHIPLQSIYKRKNWKRLCVLAEQIEDYSTENENEICRVVKNIWLSCNSYSYFKFILSLAKKGFCINFNQFNENQKIMCLMLHYDVWQAAGNFNSLEESIKTIGYNKILVEEIIDVLEILIDKIDFIERDIDLPFAQPLKIHSRYTRSQILAAFGFHTFTKESKKREGVAFNKDKNTELLFITLDKSEKDFSPTTLYNDFAISETLFHWQSQNESKPDSGKGLSYIQHKEKKMKILLFVREKSKDEFGNTMSFVFLGEGNIIDYYDSKPMNIKWKLNEPMPPYLWKDSAKMAVG